MATDGDRLDFDFEETMAEVAAIVATLYLIAQQTFKGAKIDIISISFVFLPFVLSIILSFLTIAIFRAFVDEYVEKDLKKRRQVLFQIRIWNTTIFVIGIIGLELFIFRGGQLLLTDFFSLIFAIILIWLLMKRFVIGVLKLK